MEEGYTNVNNAERWLSVVGGSALAAYGLTRRSATGLGLAALGGALVWRGATGHCMVYDALGVSSAQPSQARNASIPYGKGFRVEKGVVVDAPPEQLFAFWRDFSNLPRFMSHLQSVDVIDSKRSHWRTKGPAGMCVEWDAEVINEVPNELIGWRSVEGSTVNNAGSVHFDRTDRGTEVRVILRYDPPAGALGAAIAKAFGEDPATQIEEDLRQFKRIVSTSRLSVTDEASASRGR